MTDAHDTALLTQIRAATALTACVYDSAVVDDNGQPITPRPAKYVLVYGNRGVVYSDRLTGTDRRRRKTYWIHSVGTSKRQASAVSEQVLTQLLNWTPSVPGWTCTRVTHEASQPVDMDDTVKPVIFSGVDQFDFYTEPLTNAGG